MIHPLTSQLYRIIGVRVRDLRLGLATTQETLAKRIGAARTTVTNLERGKQHVPLHQLLAIAEALQVELSDLMPSHTELAAARSPVPLIFSGVPAAEPPPQTAQLISTLLSEAKEADHG